jgi:hypothetical protein|tara:strand:- start:1240 stop:1452 length:213 start_codon:yes stop_codon:yes gene_type:complete
MKKRTRPWRENITEGQEKIEPEMAEPGDGITFFDEKQAADGRFHTEPVCTNSKSYKTSAYPEPGRSTVLC